MRFSLIFFKDVDRELIYSFFFQTFYVLVRRTSYVYYTTILWMGLLIQMNDQQLIIRIYSYTHAHLDRRTQDHRNDSRLVRARIKMHICRAPTKKKITSTAAAAAIHTRGYIVSQCRARTHTDTHILHCSHNLNVMMNLFVLWKSQEAVMYRMKRK